MAAVGEVATAGIGQLRTVEGRNWLPLSRHSRATVD